MTKDEKIYSLMVQAEEMQAHAEKLQDKAEKIFAGLPLAVAEAGREIRATGLQTTLIMLGGLMVGGALGIAVIWWGTSSLRDEAAELRAAMREEEATLAALRSKTWSLELVSYSDGGRGIILPKGVRFERSGKIPDGRDAIVIKP